MLLFYIRHGDPIYDPDSLTPLGLRQAEAVAKRLSLYGLDEIYASSSNRAILTSKPTCEILKKEAKILDWCNEGHAWQELVHIDENGRKDWLFAHPSIARRLISNEFAALGENWAEHPMFEGTNVKSGIERIRRETYSFLIEHGYVFDPENIYINARLLTIKELRFLLIRALVLHSSVRFWVYLIPCSALILI